MQAAILVFLASFAFVGLKAFQGRNIAFLHYRWIMPISYAMGIMEVCIWSTIATSAINAGSWWDLFPIVNAISFGGGFGCLLAMYLHNRFIDSGDRRPERDPEAPSGTQARAARVPQARL